MDCFQYTAASCRVVSEVVMFRRCSAQTHPPMAHTIRSLALRLARSWWYNHLSCDNGLWMLSCLLLCPKIHACHQTPVDDPASLLEGGAADECILRRCRGRPRRDGILRGGTVQRSNSSKGLYRCLPFCDLRRKHMPLRACSSRRSFGQIISRMSFRRVGLDEGGTSRFRE